MMYKWWIFPHLTFYRRVHVSLCWTLIMSRRFLWWFPNCLGDIELGPSSLPVPPLRPRSFKHPWHVGWLQSPFGGFLVPHGKDGKSLSCFLGTFWWVGSSTAMFFERASKSLTANVSQIGFAEVIQSGFCECQLLAFFGDLWLENGWWSRQFALPNRGVQQRSIDWTSTDLDMPLTW